MEHPEKFLKNKYWSNEQFREATEQTAQRTKIQKGEGIPNLPDNRIGNYLQRFSDIFERDDEENRERGVEAIKHLLHKKYVIKTENISEEYIKGMLLSNFAEKKGYSREDIEDPSVKQALFEQFQIENEEDFNTYTIPEHEQEEIKQSAIKNQEKRLDTWFSYLTTPEAEENIPSAYRYWAFGEMLRLGSYDQERNTYNIRDENTVAPFPELDHQALALVIGEIRKKQRGESPGFNYLDKESREEFLKRLKSENFGKLYAFVQEYLKSLHFPEERLIVTEGEWRVFSKGSEAKEVVKSLEGFHTQWCISAEGTAEAYLKRADLWVYFSQDTDGNNSIPRSCIVNSEAIGITEVRGIMSNKDAKQHLDDYITPIVEKKLKEMPNGEKWSTTMKDMKQLASINIKHISQEDLSKDDLRFIYQIDRKIQFSGYEEDPRIEAIQKNRDVKSDLSYLFEIPKEKISLTEEEALSGDISYHYGDLLYLGNTESAKGLVLPEVISGDLHLGWLQSAERLVFPKTIGGNLLLATLQSAKAVVLPKVIGGGLYLGRLQSAEEVIFPETVGENVDLRNLLSAEGLVLPKTIVGNLNLTKIQTIEAVALPETFRSLYISNNLTRAEKEKLKEMYPGLVTFV